MVLAQQLAQSVQGTPDAKETGGFGQAFWTMELQQRGPILPTWGTRARERMLRYYDRHDYSTLWQGAVGGLITRWQSTPWAIDGGRTLTNRFQRMFRSAQFGQGWDSLIARVARDYLRFDGGAFIEVIAPGDPMSEPTGPVVGLAHLDSYHCLPTADPVYPVLYYSRPTAAKPGMIHLLHHSRVIHLIDMEDGDQDLPGYGLCALSRAIAVVQRQMYMGRYVVENLDDKPSPGIVIANNMSKEDRDQAFRVFRGEQQTDAPPDWGKVAWFFNLKPDRPATLENVTFSRPPEKFDFNVYVRIDVDELALAIGVDSQDLFPLASRSMGSGAQSEILHEKAKGKTYGHFLTLLERKLNDVLPEELEFTFKTTDPQQAQQDAATASAWAGFTQALPPTVMSDLEKRQLLADQIDMFQKVVTDERGQLIELPDTDVKPPDLQSGQVTPLTPFPATIAADTTPNAPALPAGQQTTAQDNTPNPSGQKDYEDTRSAFVLNLVDLIHAGGADEVNRRRAGIVMRAQLNSSGKAARNDGLVEGGVEDGLSDSDLADHAVWLAEQSAYVTSFLNDVYQNGLTDAEIDAHAEAWANKSLQEAYFGGLQSADSNGMYEFVGQDGLESCRQCKTLKGQVHRMRSWADKQLRPGVDTDSFDCGGFQCQHSLAKTSGRASGNWVN